MWLNLPQRPGKAFHLTVDWQLLDEGESGQNRVCHTHQENVHEFLADMTFQELTGKNETFNTLVCAISAVEKIQRLESLQPKLAWKPLEIIKHTLENTTQFARVIARYPMTTHCQSRFPWDN